MISKILYNLRFGIIIWICSSCFTEFSSFPIYLTVEPSSSGEIEFSFSSTPYSSPIALHYSSSAW